MAGEITFEVKWDKETERKIAQSPIKALDMLTDEAVAEAIHRSPYKTGLNRKIESDAPSEDVRRIFTVSGYGAFLELGTGIFGPTKKILGIFARKKKRIVPKRAKALSWITAGGQRVFYTSVKGRPATPYMRPALEDVKRRAGSILKDLV